MLFLLYAFISCRYLKIIRPLRANRGSYNAIGGIDLKEGIFALLALFALISITAAEYGDDGLIYREENNLTFNMEQKVSGTGFFAAYKYALMPDVLGNEGYLFNGVEAKNRAHASGSINTESTISGESTYVNESNLNADAEEEFIFGHYVIEVTDEYEEEASSFIELKEDNELIYSPINMAIGTGYFSIHPLKFNSLIKDGVYIKNRDGFSSMNHVVDNAHGLKKLLNAQSDTEILTMTVEEDLTEGKSHFGALQLVGIPRDEEPEDEEAEEEMPVLGTAMKAWMKPKVVLDEDFVGTFHITKNMTLGLFEDDAEYEDPWLPCCFGGYLTMPTYYKKGSKGFGSNVNSIFDCTCWKQPGECAITTVQY